MGRTERDGTGRRGTGLDGKGQDGMERGWTGRRGTGQEGEGRDGVERNGTPPPDRIETREGRYRETAWRETERRGEGRDQRRRQGGTGPCPPWAPNGPLCLFDALQSRMCLQGKCSWRAPPTTKNPSESPSMCLKGKFSWRAPSGALKRRKVPTKSPSNDGPYGALLG